MQIGGEQRKQVIQVIVRRLATRRERVIEWPAVLHPSNVLEQEIECSCFAGTGDCLGDNEAFALIP